MYPRPTPSTAAITRAIGKSDCRKFQAIITAQLKALSSPILTTSRPGGVLISRSTFILIARISGANDHTRRGRSWLLKPANTLSGPTRGGAQLITMHAGDADLGGSGPELLAVDGGSGRVAGGPLESLRRPGPSCRSVTSGDGPWRRPLPSRMPERSGARSFGLCWWAAPRRPAGRRRTSARVAPACGGAR